VRDWLPLLVLLAATFVVSSIPGDHLPPLGSWNADKLLHAVEFSVIGALLLRLLRRTSWGARATVAVLLAVVMTSAWGALDEVHQLLTPNRSSDWRDWVADTAGALVGALIYLAAVRARTAGPGKVGAADPGGAAP